MSETLDEIIEIGNRDRWAESQPKPDPPGVQCHACETLVDSYDGEPERHARCIDCGKACCQKHIRVMLEHDRAGHPVRIYWCEACFAEAERDDAEADRLNERMASCQR